MGKYYDKLVDNINLNTARLRSLADENNVVLHKIHNNLILKEYNVVLLRSGEEIEGKINKILILTKTEIQNIEGNIKGNWEGLILEPNIKITCNINRISIREGSILVYLL